jgi:hypothetical protein
MSAEGQVICYLIAFVFFAVGAVHTAGVGSINWVCVGLAAWVLVPLWFALEAAF